MSPFEFELEVRSYLEMTEIMRGEKKPGPTQQFLDLVKQLSAQQELTVPVTPEEVGWE